MRGSRLVAGYCSLAGQKKFSDDLYPGSSDLDSSSAVCEKPILTRSASDYDLFLISNVVDKDKDVIF